MSHEHSQGQPDRIEKPEIRNHILKSTMQTAAHGNAESLAALKDLIDLQKIQGKTEDEMVESNAALAWAKQEAWTRKQLKVFDSEVRKDMKRALSGEISALSDLGRLAASMQPSAKEAEVVLKFVRAKLGLPDDV